MSTTVKTGGDSEKPSSYAETIESPVKMLQFGSSTIGDRAAARERVAIVEGSAPHLSQETLQLLRDRLRVAAIVLCAGFATYLARSLWTLDEYLSGANAALFAAHIAVTLLLAVLAWRLCVNCTIVTSKLRLAEFLIFGGPAVFFLLLGYYKLLYCANLDQGHAHIPNITAAWCLLIFAYAVFVPNTWQRASVVLGLMAVAPIATMAFAYATSPQVAQLLDTETFGGAWTENFLFMSLTSLIGVVGVRTIGSLRQEAFAARQLGQYRLKQKLGSGGMGEVYLAEHEMMKRPCAIKIIRPEKAGDSQVIARFEREVRSTAKLSHWNSIDIYDYGKTADGTFYYVMEFLPGHNVGELVNDYGPMPESRLVYLMKQVCDALAEAHNYGLIHRDIKPANIFCAYRGGQCDVAKILDFGLAKPISQTTDSQLTQEGSITGSPLYMSPEQAGGGEEMDARSDIYSLGALMYFLSTGKAPFEYKQPLKVLIAHASETPRPPRELNDSISSELEEIILRCLEKQAEDRFQDVLTLKAQLEGLVGARGWTSQQATEWWDNYGCPERKALAAAALEMAAV